MKQMRMRNFHLPLSEELYQQLREAAARSMQPATEVARRAILSWLREEQKKSLHHSIADYAARHAGTPLDLDEDLERASLEHLSEIEEKRP